mgnify:CR=1 FL=1
MANNLKFNLQYFPKIQHIEWKNKLIIFFSALFFELQIYCCIYIIHNYILFSACILFIKDYVALEIHFFKGNQTLNATSSRFCSLLGMPIVFARSFQVLTAEMTSLIIVSICSLFKRKYSPTLLANS